MMSGDPKDGKDEQATAAEHEASEANANANASQGGMTLEELSQKYGAAEAAADDDAPTKSPFSDDDDAPAKSPFSDDDAPVKSPFSDDEDVAASASPSGGADEGNAAAAANDNDDNDANEPPQKDAEVFRLTSPIVDDEESVAEDAASDTTLLPADPDGEPSALSEAQLASIVESLLFAADKPLAAKQLADLVGTEDLAAVRAALATLEARYADGGVQLHAVAGGHQFRTNPVNATWVQKMLATKPVKLSRAQLEALAICSYRQPITRPEIDDIRGVDSGGALRSLMDRSLIRILGKKEEPGRPLLYGTTKEFLEFFNLSDLKDLPTLREYHELSDEHRAQVAALEEKAPPGSVETEEEAAAERAATRPLPRIEWKPIQDDSADLTEIDRLIDEADKKTKAAAPPPTAPPGAPTAAPAPIAASNDSDKEPQ